MNPERRGMDVSSIPLNQLVGIGGSMHNNRRNILALLGALFVFLLTSCSGGSGGGNNGGVTAIDPALKRSISGKVTDALNNPIDGVTVNLLQAGSAVATVTTAADGTYVFPGLQNGSYTIKPDNTDYVFNPESYDNVSTENALSIGGKNFTCNVIIVRGLVTNVVLPPGISAPLAGVAITATPTDPTKPDLAATSGADGSFSLPLLNGVAYVINFSKTGYRPVDYSFAADSVNNTLETVRMLQDPGQTTGNGDASGKIVNAFDGEDAPGLTINLRGEMNTTTGTPIATATTDATGGYSFTDIPAGVYTAEINGQITNTGETVPVTIPTTYFTVIVIGGASYPGQDYAVIGGLPANQYRIVLTWGVSPHDLDSHITGPAASGDTISRFHVYYANKNYEFGGTRYVDLDLDDVTSYGPETTTIRNQLSGIYRFSVHNFSGEAPLSTSRAQVKLYKGNTLKATFNVPGTSATANLWTVFEINGDTITSKNTMSTVSGAGAVI